MLHSGQARIPLTPVAVLLADPDTLDLLSGPLVLDNLAGVHTHFADKWRDGMWGTWDTDARGLSPEAPSIEPRGTGWRFTV